jgi:hypothetical protein
MRHAGAATVIQGLVAAKDLSQKSERFPLTQLNERPNPTMPDGQVSGCRRASYRLSWGGVGDWKRTGPPEETGF